MKVTPLNEKLVGDRLYLSKHSVTIAEVMFNCVEEDRDRLGKFLSWVPFIKSVEDQSKWIGSTYDKWISGEEFNYGIFLHDGTFIGNIAAHSIKWAHNGAEIGYWNRGCFESKGYMTEATKLLQEHLFEVGFHRIQIRCSSINDKSEGVPKRLGYHFEGIARADAIEFGKYRDTKTYSLLSTD